MREILFRGKGLYDGEWVKGTMYQMGIDLNPFIMPIDKHGASYEVDPSTVGQFIGLTDKNGKKIFEGDVVKFTRFNALGYATRRTGDVRYYEKLPVFYIMATTGDAWDWCDCEDIEVIGNIYDNPELLRAE